MKSIKLLLFKVSYANIKSNIKEANPMNARKYNDIYLQRKEDLEDAEQELSRLEYDLEFLPAHIEEQLAKVAELRELLNDPDLHQDSDLEAYDLGYEKIF